LNVVISELGNDSVAANNDAAPNHYRMRTGG
jgi:hypothetical protein